MNKERERMILELVVDTGAAQITDNGDKQPDFVLYYPLENTHIGIEITELYFNQSSARIMNIPNYFNEIMCDGRFRNKVDEKLLYPEDFIIINKDGSEGETFRAILNSYPNPFENYRSALTNSIQSKNEKYSKLHLGYDYMNLLIYDLQNCLSSDSFDKDHFYNYLIDDRLFSLMISSCFDEIYFITRFYDGQFYIGLKLLLILSEAYKLKHYLLDCEQKLSTLKLHFTDVLYETLTKKGFPCVSKGVVENNKVVNIGFYSIGANVKNEGLIYRHYPSKNDAKTQHGYSVDFFSDDEYRCFSEKYRCCSFHASLWTKVNNIRT